MKNLIITFNLLIISFILIVVIFTLLVMSINFDLSLNEEIKFVCGTCENEIKKQRKINNEKIQKTPQENKIIDSTNKKYELGRMLREENCTSCHSFTDEVIVGPGLKGILKRRTMVWITNFVKNSQAVIKSGDEYAIKLFEKYNKAVMTSFNFKDEEIKAIIDYINFSENQAQNDVFICQ
ncbi:MAG: cytochrome c [Bacteroidetes bacterium]|nr:MAG: cytochrome c [Bacteroidota bacterium]